MTFMFRPNALCLGEESFTSVKGRDILSSFSLGEPEAQNCPVFTSPRRRLLHLDLRLGEPKVMFFPLPSINSRNHYSFVRTPTEVNDRREIGLVDDPNK